MGLLDRLRREERVHYERNQAGKITNVEREYRGRGSRTPASDKLLGQAKDERRKERQESHQAYRDAYKESFRKARLKREQERGRRAGGMSIGDHIDRIAGPPPSYKQPSHKPHRTQNNYNPFGTMFDTGIQQPHKKKTGSSKTKYKIIGGKAYPIAGTGKKKKRKTSKKTRDPFSSFDPVGNNWRW